jgi:phenylpyruvate tautomerase PptA (4-oxalocrotonate tautomerase family)
VAKVKVYGLASHLLEKRKLISDAIHASAVSAYGLPVDKRFHGFIVLHPDDFIYPDDRSKAYTIIEFSMFEGRSEDTKKALIRELFTNLERSAGIMPLDVEITIFETPKVNWGILGIPGDELVLSYKVEV